MFYRIGLTEQFITVVSEQQICQKNGTVIWAYKGNILIKTIIIVFRFSPGERKIIIL